MSGRTVGDVRDNVNRLIQEACTNAGIPGKLHSSSFFNDATIDLQGGYEWQRQPPDGSMPDLSAGYGAGTSSGRIDIGVESVSRFLAADKRVTEIARPARRNGRGAYRPSDGKMGSRIEVMHPAGSAGRWLKVKSADRTSLDVIGWDTLAMAPHTEQLALCFIGLLAIIPAIVRRRGVFGGRQAARRRSIRAGS